MANFNFPTILTMLRIALIPVFVLVFFLPFSWNNEVATIIFVIAAVTDWFDGYLARKWNQTSAFGAFLDPVADKLMVAVALVLLVQANPTWWFVLPSAVIIGREIVVSALREWMAEVGNRGKIAVSMLGKVKTSAQMLSLVFLLYGENYNDIPVDLLGLVLLYFAAGLTLISMVDYLQLAWPSMTDNQEK